MPNIESAAKRMRQAAILREKNRAVKSALLKMKRKFNETVEGGDRAAAMEQFSAFASALDKAAKKGVIKANNASRRKSRASARLATLAAK